MTRICIPIFINSKIDVEEAIASAEEALDGTEGMVELRCDTATPKQMLGAIEAARVPVIVTVRPTWEGGLSQKTDAERLTLWREGMEAGADYLDIELVTWEKARAVREMIDDEAEKSGARLILSNHSFEGRPNFADRLTRLRAVKQARVLKMAWKSESILDGIHALALVAENKKVDGRPMVALAMGEEGMLSRLLAKKFGVPFTFASVESGKESAPGQPTVRELRERYRWDRQAADTPVFGVVGWPIGHSLSPHIHNAGFEALDVPGVYVPLPVRPDFAAFEQAIDGLRGCPGMNLRGVSVTIPHKENAIRYVRERRGVLEALSEKIGVINTLTWMAAGKVYGRNSDYAGALDALASAYSGERDDLRGKRVAVLGAGGAARAIVAGLAQHGATVVIYNRTREKAEALAAEFSSASNKVVAAAWEKLCDSCCEIYVNATPIGMHPHVKSSPIDFDPAWDEKTVVFDTIYNPLRTQLIKTAERKNAKVVLGVEMFIRQAGIQFQEFTGKAAPLDILRTVALQNLKS